MMRIARDIYLDLTRLALKTTVPGIVMLTIAPLADRSFMWFHASHAAVEIRAPIRELETGIRRRAGNPDGR